jgi:outer membrane protein
MHSFPLLATLALLAAPAARAADVKIGYVDLPRAVNEVEEGRAAKAQLKKDFDQKQKAIDEMQVELKKMKDDLEKQAVVMAEEAKREKQGELDRKFMEVQNRFMQMQQELSARERELMRGIIDKMSQVVREIAEAEGFTYVFEKNHAPPANDLTNELVRKYNAKFKAGGGEAKKKPDKPEAGKK